MREKLASELVKEIHGPRTGATEVRENRPKKEYITGVLTPQGTELRDPDRSAEMIKKEVDGDEIESSPNSDSMVSQNSFLDPKSRPHSIGLSFNVSENPSLDICITWARYNEDEEEEKYHRLPKNTVLRDISGEQDIFFGPEGECEREEAPLRLQVVKRELENGKYHIRLSLVNNIEQEDENYATNEECIFQPQMRVNIEGAELVESDSILEESDGDRIDFVYSGRKMLGRGHMCSAVWQDIDPQRPHDEKEVEEPPFHWVDGEKVEDEVREEFTCPDLRTEFIPIFPSESPRYSWRDEYGSSPELSAAELSKKWSEEELRDSLSPLVDGYANWISELEDKLDNIEGDQQSARESIQECKEVKERMQQGVEALVEDKEVRLAFCFANKVMNLQYKWDNDDSLEWRPFQLAFLLLALESVSNPDSDFREVCDLLFVPTGAGKTEAYLGLAAFYLGYRRREALNEGKFDSGVGIMMRYTLRLLTIQQFRRALRMVTACEFYRVKEYEDHVGWKPESSDIDDNLVWGSTRFSIGLWVGSSVTPNRFKYGMDTSDKPIVGAFDSLEGEDGDADAAQVIQCPVCDSILSIPDKGVQSDNKTLYLVYEEIEAPKGGDTDSIIQSLDYEDFNIDVNHLEVAGEHGDYRTIRIEVGNSEDILPDKIDRLGEILENKCRDRGLFLALRSARPSRPGYFMLKRETKQKTKQPYSYEIYCPRPDCELNSEKWFEGAPAGVEETDHLELGGGQIEPEGSLKFVDVPEFVSAGDDFLASKTPINALTTDEQVYVRLPSFVIGTVDKVARLPFQPRAGALFGNVDRYHEKFGYYRVGSAPKSFTSSGEHPYYKKRTVDVQNFKSPELIIQDELHLIDGPLGSMVGMYETAVEELCSEDHPPKYVASTATVKEADSQVKSLFNKGVSRFPPHGFDADDRFFLKYREDVHPLDEGNAGQLYMGISAPGFGPLTPNVRVWSSLLQTPYSLLDDNLEDVDNYWTLVGYFNAIRELAGALSLYRQDIPERLNKKFDDPRELGEEGKIELSGRTDSSDLPVKLSELSESLDDEENPDAIDALFTTSMFGTGVDVSRLGLMTVMGQPKTTSSYIQSTGRVGRKNGGLVVTFYRATRPRDMSHYEMFCGYHNNLDRFVEPVSVSPFSGTSINKCAGPVSLSIMRNMKNTNIDWNRPDSAKKITESDARDDFSRIPAILGERAEQQPDFRGAEASSVKAVVKSQRDKWRQVAERVEDLKYSEYVFTNNSVVLGDAEHEHSDFEVVFEDAPPSLRDIEQTTSFVTGWD